MTDTQTNIRRIAEIIRAIDTSVASISTIQIYPLQYANAKELATVITQLFAQSGSSSTGGSSRGGRGGRGGFGGFPGFGGPPGGDQAATSANSEARQANSRVIAVADDQSNSLIVSAPEDLIPNITEVVKKIDTSITDATDTRIFRLLQADAVETAEIITIALRRHHGQNAQNNNQNRTRRLWRHSAGRATSRPAASRARAPCSRRKWWPWATRGRTRCSSPRPAIR